jgi:hypothetical protein
MDHEALAELAHLHPHETCIVFRRMILTGSVHSFLFISHNFYLLCNSSFDDNPLLYSLCAIRIFMGIPRPYLWWKALDMLKKAQNMPTPSRVTSAFLNTFLAHPLMKTNELLGTIFMGWLSSMIVWLSMSRFFWTSNNFESQMLIHCILYMCTQLLLSIVFVALLHYLIHSDIERGLPEALLDRHTTKKAVDEELEGEECPICYSVYETGGYQSCLVLTALTVFALNFVPGETLRCLPCSHCFHQACIDPWLMKRKSTCPMCLKDVCSERAAAGEDDGDSNEQTEQRGVEVVPEAGSTPLPGQALRPHQE